jgi:hypothetical protein
MRRNKMKMGTAAITKSPILRNMAVSPAIHSSCQSFNPRKLPLALSRENKQVAGNSSRKKPNDLVWNDPKSHSVAIHLFG